MIGFEEEIAKERVRTDEGPETRDREKKSLYEMVAKLYYLPPYGSRGINRDYLLKVYNGTVFRVNLIELKHFEVDLTPNQVKKLGVVNNGLLVKKINIILESKGKPNLGFDQYEPPEQVASPNSELVASHCQVRGPFQHERVLRAVSRA